MNKILITGGTSHLGQKLAWLLTAKGCGVSILSTTSIATGKKDDIAYYKGNLADNTGLEEAVYDVGTVIHCASNPRNFQAVDVEGTKNLIRSLRKTSLEQIVYISIAGVDKSNYPYYQAKLAVEHLLKNSGLPYTIVRTTQFHNFIVNLIKGFLNVVADDAAIIRIPKGLKFQSISTEEVAALLAGIALEIPRGLLPELGGPQILSLEEMTAIYLKEFQINRLIETENTADMRHELFRSGVNLCPANTFGKITWMTYLKEFKSNEFDRCQLHLPDDK